MNYLGRKLTELKSELTAVEKKIAEREKNIMPIYHQVHDCQYSEELTFSNVI